MFKRCLAVLHGAACRAVFLGTHLYAIGFFARMFMNTTGAIRTRDLFANAIVYAALLAGVALQHGMVARPGFAAWFVRSGAGPDEDHRYLFASSRALVALFAFWRPLGGDVWTVTAPAAVVAIEVVRAAGVVLVVTAVVVINRRRAFGRRQAGLYPAWTGKPETLAPAGPYRVMRHPLYVGVLVMAWATPSMHAAHLLCAMTATAYLLVAARLEERALVTALGDAYCGDRACVPMLVPSLAALRGRRP